MASVNYQDYIPKNWNDEIKHPEAFNDRVFSNTANVVLQAVPFISFSEPKTSWKCWKEEHPKLVFKMVTGPFITSSDEFTIKNETLVSKTNQTFNSIIDAYNSTKLAKDFGQLDKIKMT